MANTTVEKNSYTVDSLYQWDKDQDLVMHTTIVDLTKKLTEKQVIKQKPFYVCQSGT